MSTPSYNLDFIKQKMSQLNGGDRKKGANKKNDDAPKIPFWKPKLGDNNIRILPYKDPNGQPFHTISWYDSRLLSERRFVVPSQWDMEDPIRDFLMEAGKERQPKAVWQFMQKLSPQDTYYVFLVDRNEMEKGVQVWELNTKRFLEIVGHLTHPDWVDEDLMHTETGHDWLVKCEETEKIWNGFVVKSITTSPRVKATKLAKTEAEVEKIMSSIPDIDESFKRWVKNASSIKELLDNALAAATGNTTSGNAGTEEGTVSGASNEVKTEAQKNVEDAFADL